jgi:hypothetical protein
MNRPPRGRSRRALGWLLAALVIGHGLVAAAAPAPVPAPAPAPAGAPAAPAALPPGAGVTRARAAIREFLVEGEDTSPALGMQLQDGFVTGLAQSGIQVLDAVDVARRLQGHPELEKCDTAICLKSTGQLLEVRHLLRVRVNVTGNSYRMTARVFSAEGASPAVLPVATQSRFCDVCTVAEAREVMMRLAEAIKRPLEDASAATTAAAGGGTAAVGTGSKLPLLGMAAGLVAMIAGAGVLFASDDQGKGLPAIGGALLGAGVTVTTASIYIMARSSPTETGVAVAFRF